MFITHKLKESREAKGWRKTDILYELDRQGLRISRPTLDSWEDGKGR